MWVPLLGKPHDFLLLILPLFFAINSITHRHVTHLCFLFSGKRKLLMHGFKIRELQRRSVTNLHLLLLLMYSHKKYHHRHHNLHHQPFHQ
jgi:hypothetical protein